MHTIQRKEYKIDMSARKYENKKEYSSKIYSKKCWIRPL